jgi:O-antigen ligase
MVLALVALSALTLAAVTLLHAQKSSAFEARTTTLGRAAFALVAIGIALVTFNALRPAAGATASDVTILLALLVVGLGLVDSSWRLGQIAPTWLLAAGALLLSAALLVGIFPARPSHAALLFPGSPLSGSVAAPTATPSNAGVAVRFVGALVFLPLLIAAAANSGRRIQTLADVWIAGAAINGLVALLEYLHVLNVGRSEWDDRVMGLTNHPNALGLVSAMALPVAASRLAGANGRARFYYSAVTAAVVLGIALSGSRAALLGGVLGLVIIGALYREGRRGFVRSAGIAALLVAISALVLSPLPSVARLFGGPDPYGQVAASNQVREAIYPAVWDEVLHRPVVGHGFEYVRGAHNIYLQLLHAGGIIALLGFLVFASGITVMGLRLGASGGIPDDLRNLARACVASFAVWLLAEGLVGTAVFDRYLYIPVGLVIAISVLSRRSSAQRPETAGQLAGGLGAQGKWAGDQRANALPASQSGARVMP